MELPAATASLLAWMVRAPLATVTFRARSTDSSLLDQVLLRMFHFDGSSELKSSDQTSLYPAGALDVGLGVLLCVEVAGGAAVVLDDCGVEGDELVVVPGGRGVVTVEDAPELAVWLVVWPDVDVGLALIGGLLAVELAGAVALGSLAGPDSWTSEGSLTWMLAPAGNCQASTLKSIDAPLETAVYVVVTCTQLVLDNQAERMLCPTCCVPHSIIRTATETWAESLRIQASA